MIGVILAGVMVAGATLTGWLSPAGGSVVMVTLLPLVSPGLSYISVVCEKLGMAMAGATAALDTEHGEERVARGLHREGVVLLVGLGLEERPVELVADLE